MTRIVSFPVAWRHGTCHDCYHRNDAMEPPVQLSPPPARHFDRLSLALAFLAGAACGLILAGYIELALGAMLRQVP